MAILRFITCAAIAALLCAAVPQAQAEEIKLQESQVKAGLLYNFLKYAEWPEDDKARPITVCVFGGDPFRGYLDSLQKMTVKLRPIQVKYISAVGAVSSCHLMYVNANARDKWPELRKQAFASHVLTISDFEGFAQDGGVIQFARRDSRITALLNQTAARDAGIKIGSRLMNLVKTVDGAGAP